MTIGAKIMNASWGGASMGTAWNGILQTVADKGVNFIVASGNSKTDLNSKPNFPACYKNVNTLTVLAFTEKKTILDYGSYGTNCVDLAAPGDMVFSTDIAKNGDYTYRGGTSMAAPLVCGTIAMMLEVNPSLTAPQRVNLITSTIIPDSSYASKMKFPGRLNTQKAVASAYCAKSTSRSNFQF
eukprot:Gregarina_sp_Poly_1__11104@NODE_897_length_5808_cov_21_397318_g641_i0_p4_GENE_NODE_897_length_5808_cov_21_397318_g641_i0NODE_897_length_5808_cov_21_397318_g641_i0_p4_ORF_typecomplete_len183_score22_85Peptidase_S8/PF00082_22/3_2e28_NODE_897_length_5808_cov_21_397318_g641_i022882836